MKVFYDLDIGEFDVNQLLETSKGSSPWIKSLPTMVGGWKGIDHWFNTIGLQMNSPEIDIPNFTLKVCPGVSHFLKRCILIKLPVDTLIETSSNGSFKYAFSGGVPAHLTAERLAINHHPRNQYNNIPPSSNDLHTDKINLKIVFPISIYTEKQCSAVFLNPFYHEKVEYDIMPGLLGLKHSPLVGLPVNTLFPAVDKKYYFKAGHVLGYLLVLDGGQPELKQGKIKPKARTRFVGWWNSRDN